jgi:hypothetical protein
MSICAWHRQQYLSQSQRSSVLSHCIQRYLLLAVLVAMGEL